jgi:antitoxin component YwqK of YwqJK toxin-antitoxin module
MINPDAMTRFILAGLLLLNSLSLLARDKEFQHKTYSIYVNYPTYSVRASVLFKNGKVKPQEGCTYYWYALNSIQQTESGFDGKLLHGEYKAFYLSNALKEWGQFRYGVKVGVWKNWYANGKVADECAYRNGRRHGTFRGYDEEGRLVLEAHYRHGRLHGTMKRYYNGELTGKYKYKKGKEKTGSTAVSADTLISPSPTSRDTVLQPVSVKVDSSTTTDTLSKPKRFSFLRKSKSVAQSEDQTASSPATTDTKTKKRKRKTLFRQRQILNETPAPEPSGNAPQN